MIHERLPANFGKPWSAPEDTALTVAYGKGKTIRELAAEHFRTQSSVRLRLEKLGLIAPEQNSGGDA